MDFDWLDWSNPVAVWWFFLVGVSGVNVAALLWLQRRFRSRNAQTAAFAIEPLLLLCTAYVLGCAFRSLLPRADVQRICLFDTWLSSVLIGRSVATVAELCFAMQWAIVLRSLGEFAHSHTAKNVAKAVMPLIALAECCSWYAVITTNFLGNVLENSLWTITFVLVGMALVRLLPRFRGPVQIAIAAAATGTAGYAIFMCTVDVPMYSLRFLAQVEDGHQFLGLFSGWHDLATRWVVTHNIVRWQHEIPWMSLYFSLAVWTSLALGSFGLFKHHLPRYCTRARLTPTKRPIAVPVRFS